MITHMHAVVKLNKQSSNLKIIHMYVELCNNEIIPLRESD